jgi:DNA primase
VPIAFRLTQACAELLKVGARTGVGINGLPSIPREKIDDVRERTNIVEVVKRHVELKRAGTGSWMGLCPFHAEKTPSFHVHEPRQFFHCFGCGEKGDVFTFVTKIEQRSFMEVLRDLARDAGIELPEKQLSPAERQAQADEASEKERMFRAVEAATAFFEAQLSSPVGEKARAYVESRGISPATAARFRVGYAPAGWESLQRHLAHKGIGVTVAETLGLVGANDRGRYDFFRDRIMLPVLDRQKRPVGFSSRLLDPDAKERKYVNSPDSPLFHKKEQLYGLHAALDPIRRGRVAIVVEGNFDVMSLHEAGIDHAVAPMGTALTTEQVSQLGRIADRVIVLFDGDQAGSRAALKAVPLFVEADVDGRVAKLPAGVDPDDFVRKEGADAFRKLAESARPAVDHFIDDLARRAEATIPGRMSALEEAAPLLARVTSQTARELYVGRLASTLGLSGAQVLREVRAAAAGGRTTGSRNGAGTSGEASAPASAVVKRTPPRDELEAVTLIVLHPELGKTAAGQRISELLVDDGLKRLCRLALEALERDGRIDVPAWLDAVPADISEVVSAALGNDAYQNVPDLERFLAMLVASLELARVEAEFIQTNSDLERARERGDDAVVRALPLRLVDLKRRKLELTEALRGRRR